MAAVVVVVVVRKRAFQHHQLAQVPGTRRMAAALAAAMGSARVCCGCTFVGPRIQMNLDLLRCRARTFPDMAVGASVYHRGPPFPSHA